MLEIRAKEISELSDEDLWALVGRLCEAELSSRGLPSAGVSWGGDPNAGDGGIDVRVDLSTPFDTDDFIPRNKTGIQVKKPDMPRNAILKEMRPKGTLRPAIIELAQARGAYIIVSGRSSLTKEKLDRRKEAMLEALSDLEQADKLKIDYYDADRLATWVRCHPAMILWVRHKIGKPVQGWLPYQNWANPKGGLEEVYLPDEILRLYDTANSNACRLSLIDGMQAMRSQLRSSSGVIRLIGLSGVGKTRFVQALFDERIGAEALEKSQVCYTDVGLCPIPGPVNFAQQLVSLNKPITLVVDNCPPELHRALTKVCSAQGSLVRLLTIEYDVQGDKTEVYHLAPASDQFIEDLIRIRLPHVSRIDARTIAKLSGGNARLALALANMIRPGESLPNLKDEELFRRLFEQRHGLDQSLLRTAEACSLVYSFDSTTVADEDLEISLLSRLAEKTVSSFHRDVTEIEERQLIQSRNHWKALLPHALANKLAETALKRFLVQDLLEVFEFGGSERLLQSFSRRLSYLHESETARSIARRWLAPDGLLGDLLHLNRLGMNVLNNIAPVEPHAVLSAIDRAKNLDQAVDFLSAKHIFADEISRLLWALAYDSSRFDQAVDLLCYMALTENTNETNRPITQLLSTLFHIQLSGTHAPVEQRLKVIQQLIDTGEENRQQLGLSLLTAALKASDLYPVHHFMFGALSRDYGAANDTKEAISHWYGTFLDYSLLLLRNRPRLALRVMNILSDSMQGLWNNAKVHDKAEQITQQILQLGAWNEGWLAVRETLRTVGKNMPPEIVARLQKLESELQPKTLMDRARAYALTTDRLIYALYEEEEDINVRTSVRHDKLKETTRGIGREVAGNQDVLTVLLPELLSRQGVGVFELGQGLAAGSTDPRKMWEGFCEQLMLTEPKKRNLQLLSGFLNRLWDSNEGLAEQLLDESVDDDLLSKEYPYFQTSITINYRGVERLKRSIKLGLAPISSYKWIGYGGVHEPISDSALLNLLRLISEKPGGNAVAIGILHMRVYNFIHNKKQIGKELVTGARQLLINYQFSENDRYQRRLDHELAEVFATSFGTKEGQQPAEQFGDNFAHALEQGVISYFHFQELINAFAQHQPLAFLNTFVKEHLISKNIVDREFFNGSGSSARVTPAELIPEETLLNWCEIDPVKRYPVIVHLILPYRDIDNQTYRWNPLAIRILENTSDTDKILEAFAAAFDPSSWFGSLLNHFIKGAALIAELKCHEDQVIASWANEFLAYLSERIEQRQEWETRQKSYRQEGFE